MNQNQKATIDENGVRFIALQVVIITTIAFIYKNELLLFLLSLDFAIRAFSNFMSPLARVAKTITNRLKFKVKPVFAPPKKFAAALGFIFAGITGVFVALQHTTLAYSVGGLLLFCATLEALFKICVGCYAFNGLVVLQKYIKNKS